jgi:hypothetical protein
MGRASVPRTQRQASKLAGSRKRYLGAIDKSAWRMAP